MTRVQIQYADASNIIRERLTAARTYYVDATDGDDANDGLTSGTAFQTIQYAIDTAATLDLSIYDVTIQLADDTYTANNILKSAVGAGKIIIQGNSSTPANVICAATSSTSICFYGDKVSTKYQIKDMKLQTGDSLLAEDGTTIEFGNIEFGAGRNHLYALNVGYIKCISNYTISGNATRHMYSNNGNIRCVNLAVTVSGTPAWSNALLGADRTGVIVVVGTTWTGSATGKYYAVVTNGVVSTAAATLPGSVAGTTATGGQFD